jgi:hypothetical protein
MIDLENVQPETFSRFANNQFCVLVFVGANQNRLPFEMVASLQRLGFNADYVKISSCGNNALDFHIAYYVGKLAAKNPSACFYIVSKDKGFDPLLHHLDGQNIFARRFTNLEEISPLKKNCINAQQNSQMPATRALYTEPPSLPVPHSICQSSGTMDGFAAETEAAKKLFFVF